MMDDRCFRPDKIQELQQVQKGKIPPIQWDLEWQEDYCRLEKMRELHMELQGIRQEENHWIFAVLDWINYNLDEHR